MNIDLTRLFKEDGTQIPVDHNFSMKCVDVDDFKPFVSPIKVQGYIRSHAGAVELVANVSYDFSMPCNRCMEETLTHKSFDVKHLLVRELNEEDNESYIQVEDKLDLDELIYSDVILELPVKYICKDDCRGLCPQCGANLNITNCNCEQDEIDPRLEALKSLLDNN